MLAQDVDNEPAEYHPRAEVEVLGYVQDQNRVGYSRDIGRSSIFAGRCYYIFGDTFCKNDQGLFVGVSCNTVAVMPNISHPLETRYLDIKQNGIVKEFLALNEEELDLEKEKGSRIILWAFGGIVESRPGVGWVWYQKSEIRPDNTHHYYGVGIARVSIKVAHVGIEDVRYVVEETGLLSTIRLPSLIFQPNEPRIGTFSSLVDGQFVYLWGDDNQHGIILARVSTEYLTDRSRYRFWNGNAYVENWREATQVLGDTQHGCFFRSSLFGSERPWVFVGCSSQGDSQVMLGAAGRLEGPWAPVPLFLAPGIDQPNQMRYCMYAHPWAFDEGEKELLVTWSETWPGGVIGAKVKLALGISSAP